VISMPLLLVRRCKQLYGGDQKVCYLQSLFQVAWRTGLSVSYAAHRVMVGR